jgi:cytochrome P450
MPDPLERMANAEKQTNVFAEYIDWRAKNPSDDLMTELLNAEYEDADGARKKLTREEVLGYIGLLAGAGNETTTRLIAWTGKVLAEHPDQLARVAQDRSLVPKVIEEVLRYEAPSPIQARYATADAEWHSLGYGIHFCMGAALARLEGRIALDEVLQRFPNGWAVDYDNARQARTSTVRGWQSLPVVTN